MLLWLLACTGAPPDDTSDASDALTLESCETHIAAEVPAFFAAFFRCVTATLEGDTVSLWTDGLPPHPSAYYPDDDPNWEAWDTRGGGYNPNPNTIAEQDVTVSFPLSPTAKGIDVDALVDLQAGTSDEEYPLGPAGVALDGVLLFNATAAPGDDIRDEQYTFDTWAGHPENRGAYHHHSPAPGPLLVLDGTGELYGAMCDGTLVLGCTELDGGEVEGEVDAQGGHVHDLASDGTTWFNARYHTHMCAGWDHEFTPEIAYYEGCAP